MTTVMSREIAATEITAWLDYKRVKESTRESFKAQTDVLIEAMTYGDITVNSDTFVITQKLAFPVDTLLDKLEYKPRMTIGDLNKIPSKLGDLDSKLAAYIAALTGKALSHIQKMDSEDYKIGQAIAIFFI